METRNKYFENPGKEEFGIGYTRGKNAFKNFSVYQRFKSATHIAEAGHVLRKVLRKP